MKANLNINWKDVQRENVVNNVDMSNLNINWKDVQRQNVVNNVDMSICQV